MAFRAPLRLRLSRLSRYAHYASRLSIFICLAFVVAAAWFSVPPVSAMDIMGWCALLMVPGWATRLTDGLVFRTDVTPYAKLRLPSFLCMLYGGCARAFCGADLQRVAYSSAFTCCLPSPLLYGATFAYVDITGLCVWLAWCAMLTIACTCRRFIA
jgi:hypothetical protein